MNHVALDLALGRIHHLPSLPSVVLELLASVDQEDTNLDDLAQKISQDQAITARTLRLANSSFYGMERQVTSIQEAIAILGFRTVRSIVTTAALLGAFERTAENRFDFDRFWQHAIAAAVCAREIAPHLQVHPDHAYTAGLLHDIGRLVLATQFQTEYTATLAYQVDHNCPLLEAEQVVLGIDHAQVGAALTQHWKFPQAMTMAVAEHHHIACQGVAPLSLVVMAANVMASALELSPGTDTMAVSMPALLLQRMGLDADTLQHVSAHAATQLASARLILGN